MTGYYGRIQIVEIHYSKRFNKCLMVTQEGDTSRVELIPVEAIQGMTKLIGEPKNLSEVFLDLLIYDFKTLPEVAFKYDSSKNNIVYLKGKTDNSTLAIVEVGEPTRIISYCDLDLSPVRDFLQAYGPVEYLKSVFKTENVVEEKEEIENEELEVSDSVEDPVEVQTDTSVDPVDELVLGTSVEPDVLPFEVSQIEQLGVDEYLESRE